MTLEIEFRCIPFLWIISEIIYFSISRQHDKMWKNKGSESFLNTLYNFSGRSCSIHTLQKVQRYNHLSFSNKLLKGAAEDPKNLKERHHFLCSTHCSRVQEDQEVIESALSYISASVAVVHKPKPTGNRNILWYNWFNVLSPLKSIEIEI